MTPSPPASSEVHDEFDRQRRRVLWAMPTGLYLIGSRQGDEVNLMTANLVVQVCMEPKLVAVALEAESVTARLVLGGGCFSISMLDRGDKDAVRRFVKPVAPDTIERDADGALVQMAGQPVTEAGPAGLPVFAGAAGTVVCDLRRHEVLGSHVLCIGEVTAVTGEPADILRMEDTRMHYGG